MNRRLRLQLAVGVVIAVGCVWVAIGLWYLGVPLVSVGRTTERQYDPAVGELPQPTVGT